MSTSTSVAEHSAASHPQLGACPEDTEVAESRGLLRNKRPKSEHSKTEEREYINSMCKKINEPMLVPPTLA